ncbi:NUDIX hydrolase [Paenibacillus mendelii]|uniref:NUDIX hydrolase n=1 Tax=Paenibacillus mendelii TaxID=206163 RepID=A0ABV6J5X4_9BACL|nr:NUDIX hydrolase [Paenibacillus mendelii]MCQ6560019.1 NUDIX hydrolase [Paenibacillus mendelii]
MEPKWLEWVKQIQSIAQIGLTYAKDPYDVERYEALRQLSIEMVSTYTFMEKEQVELVFANEKGYATPKVDIRGVVFHQGKLLLVREKGDGAWALPGGWADIGYSPSEIAVKEIKEESGFDVKPVRLLAVMDKKNHDHPPELYHVYKFFIECVIIGGEAKTGLETSGVDFFDEHHLPELSLERNTVKQIQTMFEFLHDTGKSVILD